jgi:hypothetical protein
MCRPIQLFWVYVCYRDNTDVSYILADAIANSKAYRQADDDEGADCTPHGPADIVTYPGAVLLRSLFNNEYR